MAIHWRLKSLLAARGIHRARTLQRRITDKTGVIISLQNLCNLLNDKPQAIRLKTMEVLCSALDCNLEEFCSIKPGRYDLDQVHKLSYQNTPHTRRGKASFPDPKDYE